jgi:hypothetical protein
MAWALVPALVGLRNAFNKAFPDRDKASDGSIGDAAHQDSPSGHNPDDTAGSQPEDSDSDSVQDVRALDVDSDLRRAGWSSDRVTDAIVARMKELGTKAPLKYVIANTYIAEYPHWEWLDYGGDDPHDTHMHFSCRAGSGTGQGNPENYNGPWGFEGDDMATAAEIAQATASKLHTDLTNPKSGLYDDVQNAIQGVASKLHADLSNPDSGLSHDVGDIGSALVLAVVKALTNVPAGGDVPVFLAPISAKLDELLARIPRP